LAIDDRDRRALKSLVEQFFQRCLIGANILFDKFNTLLR